MIAYYDKSIVAMVTAARSEVTPEVLFVQVAPSEEVRIVPATPTATKTPLP